MELKNCSFPMWKLYHYIPHTRLWMHLCTSHRERKELFHVNKTHKRDIRHQSKCLHWNSACIPLVRVAVVISHLHKEIFTVNMKYRRVGKMILLKSEVYVLHNYHTHSSHVCFLSIHALTHSLSCKLQTMKR